MSNTASISCDIGSTDSTADLGIEIWLNDQILLDLNHVPATLNFCHEIGDADQDYVLKFQLKNKTAAHTEIDSENRIVKDACVTVTNLQFDGIPLGQAFFDLAVYEHDYNGTGTPTEEKFYGQMGCNGTVSLAFSTPIYMWLLEHM
jgi:hypothetical protein